MVTGETHEIAPDLRAPGLADEVSWVDIHDPTAQETAYIERATRLHIPGIEELSEIESSSRLREEDGVLYLSATLIHRAPNDEPVSRPVGFVLSPDRLITIRFQPHVAFASFGQAARGTAGEMFVGLAEAIVDRLADILEHIAAELESLSHRLFRSRPVAGGTAHRPARETRDLRDMLRRVGASGDLVSRIRDSLLSIARIVPYVAGTAGWLPEAVKARLETVRRDLTSLSDYDGYLINKVQLLLDASLGLINIEQNDIIKVLTVVSVVGVPPTLIASMYGMNFKNIPEYDWAWGYEWGLALIFISAVVPLLWFKWRGWF
ncbi:MAG: magnesium transporter CorA family protein [Alphaproteobacteria bacterium]|nr:magnesium transporter CorA family protein [Alphaproteobacteria bacterium]